MPDQTKGRFWWGPIGTQKNSRNIINVGGWIFIALGIVNIPNWRDLDSLYPPTPILHITTLVTFTVTGLLLIMRKSRTPATMALLVSLFWSCVISFVVLNDLFHGQSINNVAVLPISLFLFNVPMTWISWRALKAALFLRNLKNGLSPAAVKGVFV